MPPRLEGLPTASSQTVPVDAASLHHLTSGFRGDVRVAQDGLEGSSHGHLPRYGVPPTGVGTRQWMWHTWPIMAHQDSVVNVGPQGRIVIPARIRRDLGLEEGTPLALRTEGGRLILEPREEVLRRLRRRYARVGKTRLSDELIRERRLDAKRESAG